MARRLLETAGTVSPHVRRDATAEPDMDTFTDSIASTDRGLKVDLHVHTSADPVDNLPLDAVATVELAALHGYDAIALTHHDAWFEITDEIAEVSERTGVLVMPGIEASLDDGAHVLVVNCGREIEGVSSLQELSEARLPEHLIVPAHPFYPCFGIGLEKLEQWSDLFDALEWSHFWNRYLRGPNLKAALWANRRGVPIVGTGDIHVPRQIDRTYSMVRAQKDPVSIVRAIRAGSVEVVTEPLPLAEMAIILAELSLRHEMLSTRFWRRLPTVFADVYGRRPHRIRRLASYA